MLMMLVMMLLPLLLPLLLLLLLLLLPLFLLLLQSPMKNVAAIESIVLLAVAVVVPYSTSSGDNATGSGRDNIISCSNNTSRSNNNKKSS